MSITLNDWLALPNKTGTFDITDSATNILTNTTYNDPVLGQVLQTLMGVLTSTLGTTLTGTVDGSDGLSALTPQLIADLAANHVTGIDPLVDSTVPLSVVQSLANNGLGIVDTVLTTVSMTPAELGSLTPGDIGNLIDTGIDLVNPGGDATLPLSTLEDLTSAGIGMVDTGLLTVTGTPQVIGSLSPDSLAGLAADGVDILDAGGNTVSLTLDQAGALLSLGLNLGASDHVTLLDTAGNIAAMTLDLIGNLITIGVNTIDVTDNSTVYITVDQALAFYASGTSFDQSDNVAVRDSNAHIAQLSTTEIAHIASIGVDTFDSTSDGLSLSLAQISAVVSNNVSFAAEDAVTALDTANNLQALTGSAIATLSGEGVKAIDSTDDVLTISLAQFNALNGGSIELTGDDVVTLADTASTIAGLTTAQIATLASKGIDEIDVTGDAVSMSVAQARAYAAGGLAFVTADFVTLSDTAANLASLTPGDIASLKTVGVDAIDVTGGALSMNVAQVQALVVSGIELAGTETLQIVDTGAHVAGIAASDIAGLASAGVDSIDLSDNAATLALANAKALSLADIAFASGDMVVVADTGANIATLTTDQIGALKTIGVDSFDVTDNAVAISAAQANALASANLAFAANDVVTIVDTGENIAALTAAQIAALKTDGIDAVDATDNTLALDISQFDAYATAGIGLASGDFVTLADTGSNIAGLSAAEISALAAQGAQAVDAIDNNLSISMTQINAFSTAGIVFASDDVVRLADAGANIVSLSANAIANLVAEGVDGLDATDNAAKLTVQQAFAFIGAGLAFAGDDIVVLRASTSAIRKLDPGDIVGLQGLGVDIIDAARNRAVVSVMQANAMIDAGMHFAQPDVVLLEGSAAKINALTVDEIAHLKTLGVDLIDTIGKHTTINTAQATALADAGIAFVKNDVVRLKDTGAHINALTVADFRDLKKIGVDNIDISDNAATLTAQEYKVLGAIRFAANDRVTVQGTNHHDVLSASSNHMALEGRNGVDILIGGAKHDILNGGLRHDVLKGGAGVDEFLFDTSLGKGNVDRIENFDLAHDHIVLENSIFKAIGHGLSNGEFHAGAKAHDRTDHIIYDKTNGDLYYDHDGKGHDAAVKFATVAHGLDLSASDFLIV